MSEGTMPCTCNRYPHHVHCAGSNLTATMDRLAKVADEFHGHLDVCKRCADQPFNLCPVGAQLLQRAGTP